MNGQMLLQSERGIDQAPTGWTPPSLSVGSSACRCSDVGIPTRNWYLAAVITAGGLVVVGSVVEVSGDFPGPLWLLLLVMTCLTGWSAARMPGFPISLSMSDAFTIAAALLFGPGAGALTVACDGLIGSSGLTRTSRTWSRVLFNVTAPALSLWLAAHMFFILTSAQPLADANGAFEGVVVPLTLFALVDSLLNTGLVAGAIAIGRDVSFPAVWRQHFLPLWWTHLTGTFIATLFLLAITVGLATLQTVLVVLPLVIALVVGAGVGLSRLRRRSAEFADLRWGRGGTAQHRRRRRARGWRRARHVPQPRGRAANGVDASRGACGAPMNDFLPTREDYETSEGERTTLLVRRDGGRPARFQEKHGPISATKSTTSPDSFVHSGT